LVAGLDERDFPICQAFNVTTTSGVVEITGEVAGAATDEKRRCNQKRNEAGSGGVPVDVSTEARPALLLATNARQSPNGSPRPTLSS